MEAVKKDVSFNLFCKVKKIFGMMLVNGNKILEKAGEKNKRGYTYDTRGDCI